MPLVKKTCCIDGCDGLVVGRSWCRKHYSRWRCGGTTDLRGRTSRSGENHPMWKGDAVCPNTGRKRARKMYPLGRCEKCGKQGTDRHHKDDNTTNNSPENIMILCRKCHMELDGRAKKLAAWSPIHNRVQEPKPCIQCSSLYKPLRRGLCARCYDRKRRPKKR